ncbi:hypothetical protein BVH01_19535 [Pseudomonas sp. PA1(2017)]|uniref:hypothetical protein n=1 Tax=Pseudomonas sp. PA1(2017) TaxID=1932113 RepID=UPI00095BC07D|nr:hypothetical protein [Pseudomonas sp. PA1(2017)]OLU13552.1 hypothetical protein BVH01_19535 [Pseudomonas sp. PA1(2017)]
MFKTRLLGAGFAVLLAGCSNHPTQPLDQRLLGEWQGMRDKNGACQFFAWNSSFRPDGRFEISFFADEQRTRLIQTERGSWSAHDGQNHLTTDGVKTTEVYDYRFIDADSVEYVNTKADPTADCQADYRFTEQRVGS